MKVKLDESVSSYAAAPLRALGRARETRTPFRNVSIAARSTKT